MTPGTILVLLLLGECDERQPISYLKKRQAPFHHPQEVLKNAIMLKPESEKALFPIEFPALSPRRHRGRIQKATWKRIGYAMGSGTVAVA
jgi:hypothetical protein